MEQCKHDWHPLLTPLHPDENDLIISEHCPQYKQWWESEEADYEGRRLNRFHQCNHCGALGLVQPNCAIEPLRPATEQDIRTKASQYTIEAAHDILMAEFGIRNRDLIVAALKEYPPSHIVQQRGIDYPMESNSECHERVLPREIVSKFDDLLTALDKQKNILALIIRQAVVNEEWNDVTEGVDKAKGLAIVRESVEKCKEHYCAVAAPSRKDNTHSNTNTRIQSSSKKSTPKSAE